MQDKPQSANTLVAALSGFAIVLVVIGHADGPAPPARAAVAALRPAYAVHLQLIAWIYTFHMPLFFAISGYLLWHATLRQGLASYPRYRAWLALKAKRLLVPYVAISSLAYPLKAGLSRHALRPASLSLSGYVESLVVPWDNAIVFFWFLPTLFLLFAAAPFALRPQQGRALDVGVLSVSLAAWGLCGHENRVGLGALFNLAGAAHNAPFFVLGFLAGKYGERKLRGRPLASLGMCALAVSVSIFLSVSASALARLLLALCGIVLSCAIAASPLQRALARVGEASFSVYLFSWFPQVAVRLVSAQLFPEQVEWAVACSILCGLALPVVVARALHAWLPAPLSFVYGGPNLIQKGPS